MLRGYARDTRPGRRKARRAAHHRGRSTAGSAHGDSHRHGTPSSSQRPPGGSAPRLRAGARACRPRARARPTAGVAPPPRARRARASTETTATAAAPPPRPTRRAEAPRSAAGPDARAAPPTPHSAWCRGRCRPRTAAPLWLRSPHVEAELPAPARPVLDRRELERADLGRTRVQVHVDDLARLALELGLDRRELGDLPRVGMSSDRIVLARRRSKEPKRNRLAQHEPERLRQTHLAALFHTEGRHAHRIDARSDARHGELGPLDPHVVRVRRAPADADAALAPRARVVRRAPTHGEL